IRKKLDLPARYILFVGRLNARKNIEALLKAMVVLADKDIRLVVVGSQEWKAPDLQTLTSVELAEKVQFTGSVNDRELSMIYAMATIFCFPSFAEGFGIPPLEAMASGVPVIVSNTTSIPEVCSDAALYINPHKPEEIANSIMLLLNDKSLYQEKRAAGLKRAKLFTWENTAHGILQSMTRIVTQASL
ncbi:MAG: glycosyltransferase family 4 protein, partial [Flavisolibacter sp.]